MAEQRKRGTRGGKNRVRRRDRKNVPRGRAYIASTFNNTLITLTDPQGMSWRG
jgi:small subunit ribosomal protein S11